MSAAIRTTTVALVVLTASAVVAQGRELSFADRVAAQKAIERVYYSHQIGAEKSFEEAVPRELLERKVVQYLKQSAALEEFWNTPVTAEMLERELQRMSRGTRLPERLRALFAALDDDPLLIQETLARATLVDRLTRNFYAFDPKIHAAFRQEAGALHRALTDGTLDPWQDHPRRTEAELIRESDDRRSDPDPSFTLPPLRFDRWRDRLPAAPGEVGPLEEGAEAFHISVLLEEDDTSVRLAVYRVEKTPWSTWWQSVSPELKEAGVTTVASRESLLSSGIGRADRTWDPHGWDFGEEAADGGAPCVDDDTWDNGSLDDAPEPRIDHTAVWTGSHMLVWGGLLDNITETSSGERYDPATDTWTPTSVVDAPSPRLAHTAVWTGGLMLIWGGEPGPRVDTGGRYDPVSDSWTPTSTVGAPVPRGSHVAVWAGNLMLVWGGEDDDVLDSGGRYDPATDSWMPTSVAGAPSPRYGHTAVWTGSHMLVWGGRDQIPSDIFYDTGGQYDPVTDTWTPTSVNLGVPSARQNHTAVWTGSHMLVWGGQTTGNTYIGTGAQYDPASDSWTPMSDAYAPSPRNTHTAVWTGDLMLIWGGRGPGTLPNSGGRYDPASDSWTSTSLSGAPLPRVYHTAVWTGDLMLIWGGAANNFYTNTGGRYDPVTNTWTLTSTGSAPPSRTRHTAVWTGSHMLIWGGIGCCTFVGAGERYDPATDAWTPISIEGEPSPRIDHTAVWTGSFMLIWGGGNFDSFYLSTGGRYDPVTDIWTPTSMTTGVPQARRDHTAVWTGGLMLIWGGVGGGSLDTGGRYDPESDTWMPTSVAGAPSARSRHTAVWTGSLMLVWGGASDSGPDPSLLFSSGGRYDPATDTWTPTSTVHPPSRRYYHTAIWTGGHMLVWGGKADSDFDTGGLYDPAADTWLPTSTVDAPSPRWLHTATWTGSHMLIWGGVGGGYLDTGGRYDPVDNIWTEISTIDAPSPRVSPAVWTGSYLLVWAGNNGIAIMNTGGRYALGHSIDDDSDGYSECAGDCNDGNASIFPGAPELCDGLDNDCDFTIDEAAEPPVIAGLTFESESTLSWQPAPPGQGATHDISRGLLGELPVGSGVAEICLASEPGSTTMDPDSPVAGVGYWYLVRGRNDCGTGTYGQQSDTTERMTAVCP